MKLSAPIVFLLVLAVMVAQSAARLRSSSDLSDADLSADRMLGNKNKNKKAAKKAAIKAKKNQKKAAKKAKKNQTKAKKNQKKAAKKAKKKKKKKKKVSQKTTPPPPEVYPEPEICPPCVIDTQISPDDEGSTDEPTSVTFQEVTGGIKVCLELIESGGSEDMWGFAMSFNPNEDPSGWTIENVMTMPDSFPGLPNCIADEDTGQNLTCDPGTPGFIQPGGGPGLDPFPMDAAVQVSPQGSSGGKVQKACADVIGDDVTIDSFMNSEFWVRYQSTCSEDSPCSGNKSSKMVGTCPCVELLTLG